MKVTETSLPGVVVIDVPAFADSRGYFLELHQEPRYRAAGLPTFVQDNVSRSNHGVLRGMHYQHPSAQGKLISVLEGEIWDVALDIRPDSPTFGRWVAEVLSADNRRQLYVPEGYAHGFCVTSAAALVLYKCTSVYDPKSEGSVVWDDPDAGIRWPVAAPVLSDKDARAPRLRDISRERLPRLSA
jgi:dTDP-4-dehydrorhamnose 3,5-epimerase